MNDQTRTAKDEAEKIDWHRHKVTAVTKAQLQVAHDLLKETKLTESHDNVLAVAQILAINHLADRTR